MAQRLLLQYLKETWDLVDLVGAYRAAIKYWFIGDLRLIEANTAEDALHIFLHHPAINRYEKMRYIIMWLSGDQGIEIDDPYLPHTIKECHLGEPQRAFANQRWFRIWLRHMCQIGGERVPYCLRHTLRFLHQHIRPSEFVTWLRAYGYLQETYYTWPLTCETYTLNFRTPRFSHHTATKDIFARQRDILRR